MMKRTGVLFALVGAFSVVSIAQAGGDAAVQPKQEIQLTKNAWGCLSKDNLDSVLSHERDGKSQAKQQYFDDYRCLSVPEGQRFRVVSVDQGDVQFVSADNSDQQGLWTDSRFVKQ
ncbi:MULTISPECIES: surface attachment protein Sap1 [Burkholderia]|jgi:hypothetical protein|uniref:surface attachment protein Sap1 n=1 Tax=Burkholderia TaxID=32008 RepID=UPI0005CF8DF8|nr:MULTISPECIES: hypothetical protein [Burkholderia]HKT64946.1 hypothetical protein [Burkholderia sp.]AOJ88199.1 hypothetical protein WS87_16715 [Burkholderia sp. MSMB0856]KUY48856.1 hypothetical protein WS45_29890 [Burkholderia sp. RF2-non_BP3]KUY75219.1 hypothetical protein WS46_23295 [Burkholderia sp. RF4-BP95]KUY88866.1 hypothetical protein WS48_29400 [Burkholderia sp. RF7-non_BP1]